jgi:hypothetical protein
VTIALGVDWSGGRAARKKIWAALVELDDGELVRLWQPFSDCAGPAQVADAFPRWLEQEEFDVAGFDFCFGLAADHLERLDLPRVGPGALGAAIARRFRDADHLKQAVGPEAKRATDVARKTTFAPTNVRMYRQTYWGLRALARVECPVPPWSFGDRPVIEVFPRHVRRALGGTAGLKIAATDRAAIERDSDDDVLDAVLAAIAAGAALQNGFAGAPPSAASSGEGWIYSIN